MYFSKFKKTPYTIGDLGTIEITNISNYSRLLGTLADDLTLYSYYTFVNGDRLDVISEKLYGTTEYYWTFILLNNHITNTYRDLPKEYNEDLINYLKGVYPGVALKIDEGEELAGKFQIGEKVSFNTYEGTVLGKYPTLGYLNVEVTSEDSFPLNPTQPFTITGETSGDTVNIANTIEMYMAPHHYVNADDEWTRWNAGQVTPVTILEHEISLNDQRSQIKVIKPEFIYDVAQKFEREMRRV